MRVVILFTLLLLVLKTESYKRNRFFKPVRPIPLLGNADVGEPLILTPYIKNNQISKGRELSQVNSREFLNVTSFSGYFTVNETFDSNLFFWFFPSENNFEEDPVVLWLQGGPGASSLYGLFIENGPFLYDKIHGLSLREFSWHKNHSLLFIDNPVGTGYSFTKGRYCTDETEVGDDLYSGLVQFFKLFSELQTNDFFISGESYAGKYIPAIGHAIQKYNPTADTKINLKGLLIGNGYSDPINQVDYGEYVYQLGLVDAKGRSHLNAIQDEVISNTIKGNYEKATQLGDQMQDFITDQSEIADIYNHQKLFNNGTDPYEAFIQLPKVRKLLHVGNITYGDESVSSELYPDTAKSVAVWVVDLLRQYPILIYNGQLDIIVPYVLTINYLQKLNFSSAEEYKIAARHIWTVDGEVAGYVKTAGNLTECLVRDAGHIVPLDQPRWAFDMLYNFVRNISLYNN